MTASLFRLTWLASAGFLLTVLAACGGGSGGGAVVVPPAANCVSTATIVCTQYGQVQGADEGGYRTFRGIPFAAPPVGDLRWRPPAPPAKWQGVRSATAFGSPCPQVGVNGVPVGDEDCLTLNIYAVNPPSSSKQPVIVFIHGGGAIGGSALSPPFNAATPLAGHAIVVTVQYRLGLLGWLVNPALTAESPRGSSGNYALMDLIAGLQWVHDNIAQFGGDPAKVMIVGHSWASAMVEDLLASPAAAGLFSAAGMHSAVLRGGLIGTNMDNAYRWYADVPGAVGCGAAADVLSCLRAVPASTLVQSGPNSLDTGWPNIDPVILPEDPFLKLQRLGSPVPLIIGSNSDEAAFGFVFGPPLDATGYAVAIHTKFDALSPGAGAADTVLSLYPATDYTNPSYALEAVVTDLFTTLNIRNLARAASGAQRPPVWRYLFTHRYENDAPLHTARAFHGAELYFLFDNFQSVGISGPYTPSDAELALSNEIMGYWVRLAESGDPNGPGAAPWLPYDVASENILLLDDNIVTLSGGYRNAQCDFLYTLPYTYTW